MVESYDLWQMMQEPRFWGLAVFWLSFLVAVPLGIILCRVWRPAMDITFILLVMSICHPNLLGINFFADPLYRAAIRGFEVHLTDLCAIVLLGAMFLRHREYSLRFFLPLSIPYLLLLVLGALSWVVTESELPIPGVRQLSGFTATPPDIPAFATGMYPLFELFRIIRGFFLFWVVANFMKDDQSLRVFLTAVVVTAAYSIVFALYQRYGMGVYRVAAGLMHPNDFGVFVGMLGAIILPAALLQRNTVISVLMGFVAVSLLGVVVMTVSRSAVVAYGFSIGVTLLYGWLKFRTARNTILVTIGFIGLAAVVTVGYDTLLDRFYYRASIAGSMEERDLFNEQAVMMAQENVLGVGLGNFSAASWDKYAVRTTADVEPGVPAHNIFYLTLAELGWLGLTLFVLIWLRTYQILLRAWSLSRYPLRSTLLFGLGLATVTLLSQSLVHFSYRNNAVYYLLQIFVGVLVGIYYMNRQDRKQERELERLQEQLVYS